MPTHGQNPTSLSCISCRQRKVKCDKAQPCAACQRSKVDCVFPPRLRLPRGRQGGSRARNVEITRRLNRLEGLVERLGGENALTESLAGSEAGIEGPTISAGVADPEDQSGHPANGGKKPYTPRDSEPIVQADGIRYLGGDFWTSLSGEVDGLRQLLNQPSDEEDEYENASSSSSNRDKPSPETHFVFKSNEERTDVRSLHPTPPQIIMLSDIFFSRVDPLFKVLHRPTVKKLMSAAADSMDHIDTGGGQEALMFAIYFAAITSLSQDECLRYFHQDREALAAHYKHAIEVALTNADFLNSMDLVTLQAFVIYLMCLRCHIDSRSAWTLISLAVRNGHALDLHRDPADFSFPPFEREMRRRLWWQINVLEIRAAEDRGSAPMAFDHSTKMPSNLNDEDISPESMEEVTERLGGTEMTFCLMCQEVSEFARRLHYVPYKDARVIERKDREELVKKCCERVNSKYLANCDTAIPIFWVCSIVNRLVELKAWLLLQYPYQTYEMATRSEASRDSILRAAVSILEMSDMLETNKPTAHWTWFFEGYLQWHPLAVTLAELCVQTSGPLVERAWTIVDVVFDKWSDRVADTKKGTLWRPIKKLLRKARAARMQSAMQVKGQAVTVPELHYLPDPGVGPTYTARGSLQSGIVHNAVPTVPVDFLGPSEAAFLYPQQPTGYIPSDLFSGLNLDQVSDPINWNEWDEFIQSTWQTGEPAPESENMQWSTQFGF